MRASGHDDAVAGLDLVGHAFDQDPPLAGFDAKELIGIGVDFATDLFAWPDRHQNQLKLVTRVENAAEVGVFLGQLLDICDVSVHCVSPLTSSRRRDRRYESISAANSASPH